MTEFDYKVDVLSENGEVKVVKTIGRSLVKVLRRALGEGDELFTDKIEAYNNAKMLISEYTDIRTTELSMCIDMLSNLKSTANKNNIKLNIGNYDEIDFIEIFYFPVLSLVESEDNNTFKEVLYAAREDIDDCLFEVERILPDNIFDSLKKILDIYRLIYGYSNNESVLFALKSVLMKIEKSSVNTYILTDKSGLYKIGKAEDVDKRIKTFLCGNTTIRKVREYSGDFEHLIHRKYAKNRVGGEWFRLTEKDLFEIDKMLKK